MNRKIRDIKMCTRCGELITKEDLEEWRESGDSYSTMPLICPDCYDRLQRMDLEDQFMDLMKEGKEMQGVIDVFYRVIPEDERQYEDFDTEAEAQEWADSLPCAYEIQEVTVMADDEED